MNQDDKVLENYGLSPRKIKMESKGLGDLFEKQDKRQMGMKLF